jgi:hypothetical protein
VLAWLVSRLVRGRSFRLTVDSIFFPGLAGLRLELRNVSGGGARRQGRRTAHEGRVH